MADKNKIISEKSREIISDVTKEIVEDVGPEMIKEPDAKKQLEKILKNLVERIKKEVVSIKNQELPSNISPEDRARWEAILQEIENTEVSASEQISEFDNKLNKLFKLEKELLKTALKEEKATAPVETQTVEEKKPTTTAEDIKVAFEGLASAAKEARINKAREYHQRLLAAHSGTPIKKEDAVDNLLPDFKRITGGHDWTPDIDIEEILKEKLKTETKKETPKEATTPIETKTTKKEKETTAKSETTDKSDKEKEKLKAEILKKLDQGLEILKNLPEEQKTERINWVINTIESAQQKAKNSADLTFEVNDPEGNSQEEGIPVDDLIEELDKLAKEKTTEKEKLTKKKNEIAKLKKLANDLTKRYQEKLKEIGPAERPEDDQEHQPKMAWHMVYNDLGDKTRIKQWTTALRKSWAQAEGVGDDYPVDTNGQFAMQTGEALRQTMEKIQADIDQDNSTDKIKELNKELKKYQDLIKFLNENSKGYFELHPEMTESEKQHWRTKLEAKLINSDYRATGDPDKDYELAMEAINKRKELNIKEDTETPPPPPPEDEPKKEKLTIREIFNQFVLRKKLIKNGEPEDKARELAEKQAKFIKIKEVEKLIIGDSEGTETKKQELIDLILRKKEAEEELPEGSETLPGTGGDQNTERDNKIRDLAEKIAKETGLSDKEAEEIIRNQEQNLADMALREVEGKKNKWTKRGRVALHVGAPLLAGIGLGAVTGGLGFIGGSVATRIALKSAQTWWNNKEIKSQAEQIKNDPTRKDELLNILYQDLAITQQKRISNKVGKEFFNDFLFANIDLVEGYEQSEDKQEITEVVNALGAVAEVDEISNRNQQDIFERFNGWIGKNKYIKLLQKKTESKNLEGSATAVFYGALAATAREFPVVRTALLSLTGGKLGYHIGKKIFKLEKATTVEYEDKANEIMEKLTKANDTLEHNEKMKGGVIMTTGLGMLAGAFLGETLKYFSGGEETAQAKTPQETEISPEATPETTTVASELENTPGVSEGPIDETGDGMIDERESAMGRSGQETEVEIPVKPSGSEVPPVVGETSGAENELSKMLEANTEKMKAINGKDARHLWGLIEAKTGAMTNGLESVDPEFETLLSSEGRMTHIIDDIKDQLAKDPTAFGLKAGSNIDNLTSADLQTIAQNENFNNLFAGMLEENSFADRAMDLSSEATANIEANNAYYETVAGKLSEGTKLDQQAYDVMTALRENGVAPDQAAGIIESLGQPETAQAISDSATTTTETAGQATQATTEAVVGATGSEAESVDLETLTGNETGNLESNTSIEATDQEMTEAGGLAGLETGVGNEFQNEATKGAWKDIWKSFKDKDRLLRAGAFNKIFNETGISDAYTDQTSKLELLTTGHKGNTMEFTIPSPMESGTAEGNNILFKFNSLKNEMTAVMGDKEAILRNVKNPDKAIREIFRTLTGK